VTSGKDTDGKECDVEGGYENTQYADVDRRVDGTRAERERDVHPLRRGAAHERHERAEHMHHTRLCHLPARIKKERKGFPYSIPSVGPAADPGVQAVSLQVTVSHPPGSSLPLLSARPAVTSPAAEHHRPLAGTELYCFMTEAHRCKQLASGCYAALPRAGFEPATY